MSFYIVFFGANRWQMAVSGDVETVVECETIKKNKLKKNVM